MWCMQPTAGCKNWLSRCHLNVCLLILLGHRLMKALKSLGLFRYVSGDTNWIVHVLEESGNLVTWPWKLLLLLKITNMFYSYNSLSCMFVTSGMFFISFILLTEFNSTDSIFLETCLRGFFNITDIFWLLCAHKAPHLQRG